MEQDFNIQFNYREKTPSTLPDEQGKIQVTISNHSDAGLTNTSLNLYPLMDQELNFDNIEGRNDYLEGREVDTINNQATKWIATNDGDVVQDQDCISVLFNTEETKETGNQENGVKLTNDTFSADAPPIEPSDPAIISLTQYEAINAIAGNDTDNLGSGITSSDEVSAEVAAIGAAYQILATLFPEQTDVFAHQAAKPQAKIDDSPQLANFGWDFGVKVAKQVLALQAEDAPDSDIEQLLDGSGSNSRDYQATDEQVTACAALCNFESITPVMLKKVANFSPNRFLEYERAEFMQETEQLLLFGGYNQIHKTQLLRSEEQIGIPQFCAGDRQDAGKLLSQGIVIAPSVALDSNNNQGDNARLFTQLNIATTK